MLPVGCDTVVPVEDIAVSAGIARLKDGVTVEAWDNVHRRGTDSRQGALLLEAGTRLSPPEVAIAAGAGMARVRVSAQPMLAVLSTGNELIEPGEPVLPHQIRRSNVYGIIAALRRHGFQRVADDHVRDDPEEMRARLKLHLDTHDVLILSGGVSMGRFDLVPTPAHRAGRAHGVSQGCAAPRQAPVVRRGAVRAGGVRPARQSGLHAGVPEPLRDPGVAGRDGRNAAPPSRKIPLAAPVTVTSKFVQFVPVRTEVDDWGRDWAVPRPTNGSGDFTALAGTDGFVELPAGPEHLSQGFRDAPVPLVTAMAANEVIVPLECAAPARPAGAAAAGPAHFGHGPLQLPLPVLHAARAVPR